MADDSATSRVENRGMSPIWQMGLQIALLGLVGWVAYYFFDFQEIAKAFRSQLSIGDILLFTVLMLSIRLINSWRWLVICRNCLGLKEYSFGFIVRVSFLVEFVNIWFPSFIGGEAVKIWKLSREAEMSREIPISVLLDRIVGIGSLALVCLPFLVLFPHFLPDLSRAASNPLLLWGGIGFVVLVGGAAIWKRQTFIDLIRRSWSFFLENDYLVGPMLISILGYPVMVGAYYMLFMSLEPQVWLDVSAVTLIPRFGRVFPVAIAGVGAVEGGTLIIGKYLGMGAQLLAIVVAVHIFSKYVASLLGAILEIVFEGRESLQRLLSEAPEDPPVPDDDQSPPSDPETPPSDR